MKQLSELISFELSDTFKNVEIKDVTDDSRKVVSGGMFVAVEGNAADGKQYIQDAIAKGAVCVVLNGPKNSVRKNEDVIEVCAEDVRAELAHICAHFFQYNLDKIVAVTGTNGKSSTVDIVRQIWQAQNIKSASIGTLGVITKDEKITTGLTSPGSVALHRILSKLSADNVKNVAMEASSHGIIQKRIDDIKFDVCAFTNFSQDHLDYHKTLENYWDAKSRLFSELANSESVIIANADDEKFEQIFKIAQSRNIKCIGYGKNASDIKILDVERGKNKQIVHVSFLQKDVQIDLPLVGDFQVYNTLCAMAICYYTGVSLEYIIEAVKNLQPILGRLEFVGSHNSANIFVDYAHTPDALKKAILSLRPFAKNRLIVMFGCGGNRDAGKRKIMGQVASEFADISVITDDNPRNESPELIRKMILEGCPNGIEIADRAAAIKESIKLLQPGDILLVAGKGHEDYQILADKTIHFNDKEIIQGEIKCFL
ncbi:MAG: UDP-N-acetylmuramoyl-L-alanyl-D-glutamate--2,6-diaminopimelate ligase [Alphaproteobacteria bacterium]|nr:UDP-N-acetylmuramoyl-L-alanyl-D-glutamate--2,6-diaminopimelate ligase [Alphaproteobacteria bacterium]